MSQPPSPHSSGQPRLRELFERALDLAGAEREAFVERETAGDAGLRAKLTRMLAKDGAPDLLTPPDPADLGPRLIGWQPRPGEMVGNYRVERRIASGGMGTVWEARQERPRRAVALKVLHTVLDGREVERRLDHEAQALARLKHRGIAAIHELGVHAAPDGQRVPFVALELVEGARDLVRYANDAGLGIDERLRLVIEIASAVEHAHQKGVVHRDLKPANILVSRDGTPKVIDYGVARLLDEERGRRERTQTGHMLGTLSYMSPEQLGGSADDVDTRSDVYALGAVLYELVTGAQAFPSRERPLAEVVEEIRSRMPPRASTRAVGVPREVDWITERCLEKDPARRYASARELALDLQRLLAHEALAAGPASRLYRMRIAARRHRLAVLVGAALLLALLSSTFSSRAAAARERRAAMAIAASEERAREALLEAQSARAAEEREAQSARLALRRQTAVVEALGELLGALDPGEDGRTVRLYDLLERRVGLVDPRFEGDPGLRAAIHGFLAQAYSDLGLSARSAELARSAVDALDGLEGSDPLERARWRVFLARRELESGRLPEARAGLLRAVAELEPIADVPAGLAVDAARLEAQVRERTGDASTALESYRRAAELADDRLGPGDPLALVALSELASALLAAGHAEEAEERAREAHTRAVDLHGREDPVALQSAMRLGFVLQARGEIDEVVALQEEVVAGVAQVYGERHRNHVQSLCALTQAYLSVGDTVRAEESGSRALELREAHHARDLDLEVLTRGSWASVLERSLRWEEACEVLAEGVQRLEGAGLVSHPTYVQFLTRMGEAHAALGQRDAARAALEEAIGHAATLPAQHPWVVRARTALQRLGPTAGD